jgi:hypothetical protein
MRYSVALYRRAVHPAHELRDLFDRGVLAGVGARLARDALLHQCAAEVVAAGAQRELRQAMAELHPRRLQVVDHPAQHEAAGGVDAEVAQALRLWGDPAVVEELGVLPDEAERHELGEAVGLLLDAPQEHDVARDVGRGLDVAVHHRRRGRHAEGVSGGDDLDPRPPSTFLCDRISRTRRRGSGGGAGMLPGRRRGACRCGGVVEPRAARART